MSESLTLGFAIPTVWVHNNAPVRGIGEQRWLAMFKDAGFMAVTESSQVHGDSTLDFAPSEKYVHRVVPSRAVPRPLR